MSRHSSGTGNVLPVAPVDMEEVKFWLRIMEEHALLIKSGLPVNQGDLIEEATTFEREFKTLRVRAEKAQSEKKFNEIVADSMGSVKEFIRYKKMLLGMSLTNKLGSALPPLFFDHVIREAEYFMAILTKLRAGKKLAVVKAIEADFWLRIMAEHTKFIGARIDPSERGLLNVVTGFENEFDDLSAQGRDYVSFLEHYPSDVPAFGRFLQDSRVATVRLRDFKQAAYEMITKDRMLSTIPAMMADHVKREAEHFLLVLAMMEKGVIKTEKGCPEPKHNYHPKFGTIVDDDIAEQVESFVDIPAVVPAEETDSACVHEAVHHYQDDCADDHDACDDVVEDDIDDMDLDYTPFAGGREQTPDELKAQAVVVPAVPEQEQPKSSKPVFKPMETSPRPPVSQAAPASPESKKTGSKPKYKWGGNWPRQLGQIKQ